MQKSKQKRSSQLQHKKTALPERHMLALIALLESCPPSRLSRHLREVLLDYISSHKDALPLIFRCACMISLACLTFGCCGR